MEIVLMLALGAAACYGVSDFVAGMLSRRVHYPVVGLTGQVASAAGAVCAAVLLGPAGPDARTLLYGAAAGVGSAVGTLALYRGMARGGMNVAGPLSAVGAASIPVLVALVAGQALSTAAVIGICLAVPGIWLVASESGPRGRGGVGEGLVSGAGFGVLFLCLDQAGDGTGLWPVAVSQITSVVVLAAVVAKGRQASGRPPLAAVWAGLLGAAATILYFHAAHRGGAAVAAVITSLYPAFTVALTAIVVRERTTLVHGAGLVLCAVSVGVFVAG
ncbi:EamA family transporter [Actinophytocola sp. KF-1]